MISNLKMQLFLPADQGIDWDIAASLAFDFANDREIIHRQEYASLYSDIIETVSPLIAAKTGYPDKKHPAMVLNRGEWIITVIDNMKDLFGGIIEDYWKTVNARTDILGSSVVAKKSAKIMITSEVGMLLGFLSQRVLAQYDFVVPGRKLPSNFLYFIEPNIEMREKQLNLSGAPFRFWLVLHELAHSFQFENNPWLKDYYISLLDEARSFVSAQLKDNSKRGLMNITSVSNLGLIEKIQSFMTLIEGYADYLMIEIGQKIPGHAELLPVFLRRKPTSVFKDLLEKILGFDLKVNQYKVGMRFVKEAVSLTNFTFFSQALSGPQALPTKSELYDATSWVARVR
ncbi:MAG: hypothetical protein C4562_05160 [Actinobacteria bacterium]|nr:MAG: hypothetical protein C4562_05160 [Actinomycetota bacterium]